MSLNNVVVNPLLSLLLPDFVFRQPKRLLLFRDSEGLLQQLGGCDVDVVLLLFATATVAAAVVVVVGVVNFGVVKKRRPPGGIILPGWKKNL